MSEPLSEAQRIRSLRPWFLVAAMVVTWLIGVQGTTAGCGTVLFLREGALPDTSAVLEAAKAAEGPEKVFEYASSVQLKAIGEHAERTLPLAIARTLLSILLVMASAFVLSGRRNAKSFALQVLGVNALFGIANYVLTLGVRDQWIQAIETSGLAATHQEVAIWINGSFWYWTSRLQFALFEIGVPLLAALAVMSERARVFFDASLRAEDLRERDRERESEDDDS